MKNHLYTTKSICLAMLLTMLFPLAATAGCNIKFADFKLNDSIQCKMPLQKDNIMVSFEKEKCTFNSEQNTFSFSKCTTITVKSNNGEKITGVRLLTINKEDKENAKKKKPEFFSCDSGEFENGIWKGSSDAVTFQCLENCEIAGIRTSLSTDTKEAYAVRLYDEYGYYVGLVGYALIFQFDEYKNLYVEHDEDSFDEDGWWYEYSINIYSINDNSEYPEWYGDSINIITFEDSFSNYHPKRTSHWFDGFYCIIENLQNLNTTYVEDMSYMFSNYHYHERYINAYYDDDYEDYGGYENYIQNNYFAPESFFSSIFELLDFSNVKDMNHMFSNCNIYSLKLSSPNIPLAADLSGIFENSIINFITIDSNSINLRNGIFDGVGLGTASQPCVIDAPEDFYFGVDTSTDKFIWKGGCFKGYQLQAYVALEKNEYVFRHGDMGYGHESYNDDYTITLYYDKRRYVREKLKYSYYGENTQLDHGYGNYFGSYGTTTYNLTEWEDNKPQYLFDQAKTSDDNDIDVENSLTTTIRFDMSFAQYRPKSTRKWFELTKNRGEVTKEWEAGRYILICGIGTAVTKIEGLEYLNTSETTNTERMFYGLCCLESLDLSHLDFSKVTNSKDMFSECYSLNNLNVNSTLNLDQGTDENNNCAYYVLKNDNITFYFDDKINERNGLLIGDYGNIKVVSYNGPNCYLSWNSYNGKHAIIDPSFTQRPKYKTIGWFYNSSSLESVQGMEYLHSTDMRYMFYGCINLESIDFGNCDMSETEKTDSMFFKCKKLTEIAIPNSCTYFGPNAFYGCSNLTKVQTSDIASWCKISFDGSCSNPLTYAHNLYLNDVLITELVIPTSITNVGNYSFNNCSSLTSVTIPNSVTSIGNSAFSGCFGLTSITIPNSVTNIGISAFADCTGLFFVNIGNSVTSIGDGAFKNCSGLTTVTLPNSVTGIGSSAFWGCSGLTTITIPNSVTNIGSSAFYGCISLNSVTVENPTPVTISENTFSNRKNATLYVPIGSKSSYKAANFWKEFKIIVEIDNSKITFVDAKTKTLCVDNWDTNGDGEISKSEAATVITIGAIFMSTDISSFDELQYFTGLTSIENEAFANCINLTSITIPQGVTSIGDNAFSFCASLTSIEIPKNVASINYSVFTGCTSLSNIKVDAANTKFDSRDNCNAIIESSSDVLIVGCKNSVIPNSVTKIGFSAFSNCTGLESIDIPNSVTAIENLAFSNCTGMTSVVIGENVTSIGSSAFYGCSALTSVTVNNPSPITIYDRTFSNRRNAILYVPQGSKAAYQAANYWKEFKQIIEISNGIITFADSNAKSICVGKWDTNGDGELSESEAAAVTSLGTTFKKSQISSFNELQYFTGLTSISDGAFSKSTVGQITLPENITSLGKEAFLDCKSLASINIPAKVQTLGQNALSGCTAMTAITVDGSNTAFCDIDGVLFNKDKTTLIQFPAAKATAYDVPDGTKTIGRDAFYVSKLKTVTLPTTLEELGFDAFGYSNSLEALEIPEGVTTIGDYILDGCKNVKTLHIPSTVVSIGEYMCNGCNALTDVYCAMTTPFTIAKNNFTTTAYNNATLHVPAFAVDAYRDTEGWKYFLNIVGDMASNTLLADALTINVGKTETLMVNLSNSTEIDGVQFDITLPAGLDLFVDEEGDYEISTTTRSKKLTANCTKLSDGNYRFILFSTDRAIIAASEGAIMKIKLACAADAEAGIKEISFSGISLSCVSGNVSVNQFCDDFTSMVTIKKVSDIRGDANGDFVVNVTDVMEIVNNILEKSSMTFVFANADVDHNGIINITDVMNVVNLILGYAIAPASAPAHAKTLPYNLIRISPTKEGCTLYTIFNTQNVTAMQMMVTLPEGCRLESAILTGEASHTHKVMTRRIDDNRYNVVVFSTNGTTLSTDSPILNLGIAGRDGMVNVENILCTNTDFETLLSPDISTVITGIAAIIADGDNGNNPVYNTQGQRMNKPQRGINISEGRKVVVK